MTSLSTIPNQRVLTHKTILSAASDGPMRNFDVTTVPSPTGSRLNNGGYGMPYMDFRVLGLPQNHLILGVKVRLLNEFATTYMQEVKLLIGTQDALSTFAQATETPNSVIGSWKLAPDMNDGTVQGYLYGGGDSVPKGIQFTSTSPVTIESLKRYWLIVENSNYQIPVWYMTDSGNVSGWFNASGQYLPNVTPLTSNTSNDPRFPMQPYQSAEPLGFQLSGTVNGQSRTYGSIPTFSGPDAYLSLPLAGYVGVSFVPGIDPNGSHDDPPGTTTRITDIAMPLGNPSALSLLWPTRLLLMDSTVNPLNYDANQMYGVMSLSPSTIHSSQRFAIFAPGNYASASASTGNTGPLHQKTFAPHDIFARLVVVANSTAGVKPVETVIDGAVEITVQYCSL